MSDYVHWLRQSSPYINAHRAKTFVVMLPGEAIEHPNFNNIIYDLVLLHSLGVRLVLVYGSRPQINKKIAEQQIIPDYYQGLRITNATMLESIIEVVGRLRCLFEAKFSMDLASSPMQGARLRVTSGNFVTAKPIGVIDGVDFQHTGEVRRIDRKGISRQLEENHIVLLSPLGYSPTGEAFNLSCEDVAMATAIKLEADKLILYGEHKGIVNEANELIRELSPQEAETHIQRLLGHEQANLLTTAKSACQQGVTRTHIVSYAENGALLTELFTREGSGTLVSHEQFETIREATIEDVGGLMELIRPLEEQGILVRRSREVLEQEIEQFTVIERESMIIACAALYPIKDSTAGELACLAVNPLYRHDGKGDDLLARITLRAKKQGLDTLFVLTTKTAHWFLERGFQPSSVDKLPKARANLYNFQRKSKVFEKKIND